MQARAARRCLPLVGLIVSTALVAGPCLLSVGHAYAQPATSTIGLLSIQTGISSPDLGNTLTEALHRGLTRIRGVRLEVSRQDMVEIKLVYGCVDEKPACLARAGRKLGVTRLLYGRLISTSEDGSSLTASLMQLNVSSGTIEKSISEAIPAGVLTPDSPDLERAVQRWLHELALDSVSSEQTSLTTPPKVPQPHGPLPRWNRGLVITSAVLGSLASVAALSAVGTWRGIQDAQLNANGHLDDLQGRLTENGSIGTYRDFFESSQQLSNCGAVPGLLGDASYDGYRVACQRGTAFAGATNGLLIAAGGLVAVSLTTLLVARLTRRPAIPALRKDVPPRAAEPARPSQPAPPAPVSQPPQLWLPEPSEIPTEEPPPAGEQPSAATPRVDSPAHAVGPANGALTSQLRD